MHTAKHNIIQQLQREVLSLQRSKRTSVQYLHPGLGELECSFPDHSFPLGAVHEFVSNRKEDAAATNGFISGLISPLMENGKMVLWVGTKRTLFAPALNIFGIAPERILFIDLHRQKDVLWALEEGLKCDALGAVIGELSELSFTESRRLQLSVEQSRVTGFIHRHNPRSENTVACVTRWKIRPIASETGGMPGVGFPRWNVELLKVRNGKPGSWQVEWSGGCLRLIICPAISILGTPSRKTG